MWHGDNPGAAVVVREMELAAPQLGLELFRIPLQSAGDFGNAFRAVARGGAQAILVVDDTFMTRYKAEIFDLARHHALPVFSLFKDFAESGALVAYGPSTPAMYRRAAHYIDRILKGASPSDLPVEQPTKFDLFINLRTAKALGVTIPDSLLARADEVIE
jgi:putative ABC transport system substrate-binding protein